jgi:hypothetical protein
MDLIRFTIFVLNKLPFNRVSRRIIHILVNLLSDGPIRTRAGYQINFKRTGKFATSLRKAIISGSYEKEYLEIFSRIIKSDDYVVDVGAHEGFLTLLFWRLTRLGNGKVSAIEPNPENISILKNNLLINNLII